jgi:hypothetical protein
MPYVIIMEKTSFNGTMASFLLLHCDYGKTGETNRCVDED